MARVSNMKVSVQVGKSSGDTEQWMTRLMKINPANTMNSIGSQVVSSLKVATPSETGKLAAGWKFDVTKTPSSITLGIYNVSYPEIDGNLALMMDRGHGTRNGGYVRGRNYIRPAIKSGLNRFSSIDFLKGGN